MMVSMNELREGAEEGRIVVETRYLPRSEVRRLR